MFNKQGNNSTLKYRRELTPNIKFQADRIFVRNDLFEQIIKSWKASNIDFTKLKEKLCICIYEENYYKEGIIKIQDDIEGTDKELIEVIGKASNEISTKELIEHSDEESIEVIGKMSNEKSTKRLIEYSDEYSDEKPIEVIGKVSNEKSTKELNKELTEKLDGYLD